jgi:hypothetical protein
MSPPRSSVEVRAAILDSFRRDLVVPGPQDLGLAKERLSENPSRWYHRLSRWPALPPRLSISDHTMYRASRAA